MSLSYSTPFAASPCSNGAGRSTGSAVGGESAPLPAGCVADCPGCRHRGWPAAGSEVQKVRWLQRRLAPWRVRFAPMRALAEADRWGYRDKLCLSCDWAVGQWHFGLWRRDELVAIPACPVHSERARQVVALLAKALPAAEQFPLRYYVQSGAQVTLVVKCATMPDTTWLNDCLIEQLKEAGVEGLWLHLHPSAGKKVLAKNGWELAWGEPRSVDAYGGWYGPAAFQQLLPALHSASLDEAQAFLNPQPGDQVVDLYCGNGSGLRRWVGEGVAVLGVELGAEAVACARLNAPQAEVLRGSCAHRVPQLRAWARSRRGLLYVNPPRTGLEPEVLAWIGAEYQPRRIAYLSCSAGTLARDLDMLCAQGYRVERLRPYDFFPHTHHVETLALLERVAKW